MKVNEMRNAISWTAYIKQLGKEQATLMSAELSRRAEVKKGFIETVDIPVFAAAISTDDDNVDHEYFAEIAECIEFDHSTGEIIKPLATRARWGELRNKLHILTQTRLPFTSHWRKEWYTNDWGEACKTWRLTYIFGRTGKWLRLRGGYWDWDPGKALP